VLDGLAAQRGDQVVPDWAGDAAARLAHDIEEAIQSSTGSAVKNLSVHLTPDGIILRGRCRNFHTKQKAQHAAMKVCGNLELSNEIQVIE
jgi:osmotically-inducible protein OsmY